MAEGAKPGVAEFDIITEQEELEALGYVDVGQGNEDEEKGD